VGGGLCEGGCVRGLGDVKHWGEMVVGQWRGAGWGRFIDAKDCGGKDWDGGGGGMVAEGGDWLMGSVETVGMFGVLLIGRERKEAGRRVACYG